MPGPTDELELVLRAVEFAAHDPSARRLGNGGR